jgi:hypothetical protein
MEFPLYSMKPTAGKIYSMINQKNHFNYTIEVVLQKQLEMDLNIEPVKTILTIDQLKFPNSRSWKDLQNRKFAFEEELYNVDKPEASLYAIYYHCELDILEIELGRILGNTIPFRIKFVIEISVNEIFGKHYIEYECLLDIGEIKISQHFLEPINENIEEAKLIVSDYLNLDHYSEPEIFEKQISSFLDQWGNEVRGIEKVIKFVPIENEVLKANSEEETDYC